jgi:hypothetical protein
MERQKSTINTDLYNILPRLHKTDC